MLQKIYQIILLRFPTELESPCNLQVGLERKFLEVLDIIKNSSDIKDDFSFIGALMRHYPILHESLECKFIQINIIKSLKTNYDSSIIPLYVTDDFLNCNYYNHNDVCYLKAVTCYPLEKILFGAKTFESFKWFQDSGKFSSVVRQIGQGNVLCQQGSTPLLSFRDNLNADNVDFSNLITLDCQPFRQGLLTLRSSIILSDIRDFPDLSSKYKRAEAKRFDPSLIVDLKLIDYTTRNILHRQPSPISLPSRFKIICPFEISIIPKLCVDFERELKTVAVEIDPLNTVFLSHNIKNRWNIKNGHWVKIGLLKPIKNKSKTVLKISEDKDSLLPMGKNIRLAQIYIFSDERLSSQHFESDDIVYISPILWFNLNKHPSCLVEPDTKLLIEPYEELHPPYAEEAYACLIQSPSYDGKILCDTLLRKYFKIPRFVHKDDIISLNSKEQLDFHSRIQDEEVDKLKWPVVHFYISRVDGVTNPYGHLIKSTYTRLYQSGTKQHYVPISMETYYQLSSYHPVWNGISLGLSQYVNELKELIMPFFNLRGKSRINCNILFTGPPCCGKTAVVKALSRLFNIHLYKVNCHEFSGETSAVVETKLRNKIVKGSTYAPCIILLKNVHCIGREREAVGEDSRVIHSLANSLMDMTHLTTDWPIVVIGTAHNPRQLSSNLMSVFLHNVEIVAPDEEERCLLFEELLSICDVGKDVSIRYLAQRTAGFVLGDLSALINQGIRNAYSRIGNKVKEEKLDPQNEEDIILASVPVVQKDLLNALEKLQSEFADAIGAPKIPSVKFEDVGGLAEVKQEILDTIQLPLEHPEILFSGLRRSGVLLYGPPGSGKTLLAKAVATECSLNFLSVKGPELINMYVGQSEENVRAVFNQARSAVPCIIFFDELDSLAPNRGRSGDSGGVMDRVVSQLLAELDGLNKKSEVFVIGATNRPDLLDPALLRPGRFDRLLYVGIPDDKSSKLSILKALTRKFPLAADVDLNEIIDKCPPHLSGADFYSLCSNAVILRVEKNVKMLERGEKVLGEINCEVTTEEFMEAVETLVPSVSPEQYRQYQAIRAKIEKQ